ncbi:sialidase family protein [Membranihabitans marinus]|uniref:sialidase family protein n=1 Tax=Membranihabitans marinus TaxID=1227546 RepID=UPI001F2E2094|nr:sialidase family protein [Membranihabitans marinus]
MKLKLTLFLYLIVFPLLVNSQDIQIDHSFSLFESGKDGYDTYRIPAMVTAQNGDILAFCEGRKDGRGDAGNIDIVLKRSSDNGQTWTRQQVIWDDGQNTCGNPCPVVDKVTGEIHLLLTHNLGHDHEGDIIHKKAESTRTVWVMSSKDHGLTWSSPRNITSTTKDDSWGWYATGPGNGIQIEHGPNKGRLIIPCDHSYDDEKGKVRGGPYEYGSHVIYSDDHGQSWQLGGVIRPKVNECQMVELADGNGTLLMNMRSYFGENKRTHSISYDGGRSWTKPYDVDELVEPICQASILRIQWPNDFNKSVLAFLNPATSKGRHNMSLRWSLDEGKTWPGIYTLYPGPAAYSSMSMTANGALAVLYECGESNAYEKIQFQIIKMIR